MQTYHPTHELPPFDPLTAPIEEVRAWLHDPNAPREPSPQAKPDDGITTAMRAGAFEGYEPGAGHDDATNGYSANGRMSATGLVGLRAKRANATTEVVIPDSFMPGRKSPLREIKYREILEQTASATDTTDPATHVKTIPEANTVITPRTYESGVKGHRRPGLTAKAASLGRLVSNKLSRR